MWIGEKGFETFGRHFHSRDRGKARHIRYGLCLFRCTRWQAAHQRFAMISPLAASAVAQCGRAKSRRAATAAKQTSVRKTVLILLRCGSTVKNDTVSQLRFAGYGFGTIELWAQPRLPTCYCQDNERLKRHRKWLSTFILHAITRKTLPKEPVDLYQSPKSNWNLGLVAAFTADRPLTFTP
jgi:hypothetical protein